MEYLKLVCSCICGIQCRCSLIKNVIKHKDSNTRICFNSHDQRYNFFLDKDAPLYDDTSY